MDNLGFAVPTLLAETWRPQPRAGPCPDAFSSLWANIHETQDAEAFVSFEHKNVNIREKTDAKARRILLLIPALKAI